MNVGVAVIMTISALLANPTRQVLDDEGRNEEL
jgi:hypothetical protein